MPRPKVSVEEQPSLANQVLISVEEMAGGFTAPEVVYHTEDGNDNYVNSESSQYLYITE